MADEPLVLGIETSCDETGVGIVRGSTLLADAVASSVDEHARFGGVVPEVASRAHLEAMVPTVRRALKDAGVTMADLDAIAVTAGPGLMGALLVGVAAAKGYAVALDKPLYGVNHLAAHVAVDRLEHGPLPQPAVALLVSGGHSSLLLVDDLTSGVTPLGATLDDAAGEAFDKVARLLGLPFPGGPHIDRVAARRGPVGHRLPARADRGPRPGAPPLRLLLLRAEDGGGPVGRGAGACRGAGAGRRRGSGVPGGRGRRAHQQGGGARAGSTASRTCSSAAGWRPTPGCARWPRSGAERRACRCGCHGRRCARTTGRWWPRSDPPWWRQGRHRPRRACPGTRRWASSRWSCDPGFSPPPGSGMIRR